MFAYIIHQKALSLNKNILAIKISIFGNPTVPNPIYKPTKFPFWKIPPF
jgi:hypothetical protein